MVWYGVGVVGVGVGVGVVVVVVVVGLDWAFHTRQTGSMQQLQALNAAPKTHAPS